MQWNDVKQLLPDHEENVLVVFNQGNGDVECIQVTEHMTFNVGNVIKYLWRNGLKNGQPQVQDLKKALWYIEREIQRVEART